VGCLLLPPVSPAAASDSLECSKQVAVAAVRVAAAGLGGLMSQSQDEGKRIGTIRAFIRPVRFYDNNLGYFYVYDYDCVNIAHATQKDLVGKDLKDHRDAKGKYVIRELARAARKGGGFVEYYWVKPGSDGQHRKLGYVEPIPDTPYFIGTGVYLKGDR